MELTETLPTDGNIAQVTQVSTRDVCDVTGTVSQLIVVGGMVGVGQVVAGTEAATVSWKRCLPWSQPQSPGTEATLPVRPSAIEPVKVIRLVEFSGHTRGSPGRLRSGQFVDCITLTLTSRMGSRSWRAP